MITRVTIVRLTEDESMTVYGREGFTHLSMACRVDAEIPDEDDENHVHAGHEPDEAGFGFVTLDRTHTLASFEAYARWAKRLHFGLKEGKPGPSVEEIEAEFWRIVETPGEVLYSSQQSTPHDLLFWPACP